MKYSSVCVESILGMANAENILHTGTISLVIGIVSELICIVLYYIDV